MKSCQLPILVLPAVFVVAVAFANVNTATPRTATKPRIVVMTDIGGDPDDPSAEQLLSLIKDGDNGDSHSVGPGRDSEASDWIIEVVDRDDPRPGSRNLRRLRLRLGGNESRDDSHSTERTDGRARLFHRIGWPLAPPRPVDYRGGSRKHHHHVRARCRQLQ